MFRYFNRRDVAHACDRQTDGRTEWSLAMARYNTDSSALK